MVKGYFWDLNIFWRCRRNFGGRGKKEPLLMGFKWLTDTQKLDIFVQIDWRMHIPFSLCIWYYDMSIDDLLSNSAIGKNHSSWKL